MVTGVTGPTTMAANVIGAPVKSDRRSNKPIMEKRRRARINNCLNELKTLILDATKKDPARHSKLEKADILEKTVKHLQELQRQQAVMQQAADPKVINKFKAGFTDCANEVSRFPGLDPTIKRRLLQHLSNCINGVKTELHQHHRQVAAAQSQQLHAQMLPSPPSSPEQDQHHLQQQHAVATAAAAAAAAAAVSVNPYIMSTQIQHTPQGYFLPNGMQVIPTKSPNGSIALVLPQALPQQQSPAQQQSTQQQQQQLNSKGAALSQAQQAQQAHAHAQAQVAAAAAAAHSMLVAMPSRTSSTGSASSHSSSGYERTISSPYAPPSPANSYEAMDCKPSVIQHASSSSSSSSSCSSSHAHQLQQSQFQQHEQHQLAQPLSLVMKKNIKEEEQPWRPW